MMDWLNSLVGDVNSVLWGVFCLIPLLCGTGIFYTIRLRFVQVRKFGLALKILFGGASLFGKRADQDRYEFVSGSRDRHCRSGRYR